MAQTHTQPTHQFTTQSSAMPPAATGGILRLPELERYVGLKKSKIYADIAAGTFPRPIELGSRYAKGWLRVEIDAWLMEQAAKRDHNDAA